MVKRKKLTRRLKNRKGVSLYTRAITGSMNQKKMGKEIMNWCVGLQAVQLVISISEYRQLTFPKENILKRTPRKTENCPLAD